MIDVFYIMIDVILSKIEGELTNEMQKVRESKCSDLLAVSGIFQSNR